MLLTRKLTTDVFAEASTIKKPLWLIKITNYEYWPLWLFYLPLVPYVIWLMMKSRSIKFYEWSNPSIETGGLSGESKKNILDMVPVSHKPKTLLFSAENSLLYIERKVKEQAITYPIIAKPNVGEQGNGVEKILNSKQLEKYVADAEKDFIIQEYVDFPIEMGVFYARYPGQSKGRVTSVTQKKFLTVTGNGFSTVEELMMDNDRARFQIKRFQKFFPGKLSEIPSYGKTVLLEPIGNHCRGTQFINANYLINQKLNDTFDKIALQIPGFYYGRFDLRVASIEDLYKGENIRIVELNGVGSIPGHIFDPNYKLKDAWKDIIQHWDIAYSVSFLNRQ